MQRSAAFQIIIAPSGLQIFGFAAGTIMHQHSLTYYLHWLGVHRSDYSEIFCNAMEKEASHPQIIAHGNAFTWTNLELPLDIESRVFIKLFRSSSMAGGYPCFKMFNYGNSRVLKQNLVLSLSYLSRHDLCIGSRYVDTRIEASTIMSFNNVTTIHLVCPNSTIVRPLRSWKSIFWPTKWMLILI